MQHDDREDTPRFSWYFHWNLPEPRLKWVRENDQWRNLVRSYLACTSFVDAQVGRIMAALEEAGLEENIDYPCPEADAGSLIQLSAGKNRLTGRGAAGWDPPLYTNQDTLPRPPAESLRTHDVMMQSGLLAKREHAGFSEQQDQLIKANKAPEKKN